MQLDQKAGIHHGDRVLPAPCGIALTLFPRSPLTYLSRGNSFEKLRCTLISESCDLVPSDRWDGKSEGAQLQLAATCIRHSMDPSITG